MGADLPDYYFRVRDNGATVFRVDIENRQRRIDLDQIAVVNIRNGEIKPQGSNRLPHRPRRFDQGFQHRRMRVTMQRHHPHQRRPRLCRHRHNAQPVSGSQKPRQLVGQDRRPAPHDHMRRKHNG